MIMYDIMGQNITMPLEDSYEEVPKSLQKYSR